MENPPDLLKALVDTLRFERDVRVNGITHAIKLLRGASLMVEALMHTENEEEPFNRLEAVHTHVNDLKLWMEDQLQQEIERRAVSIQEGGKATLH